MACRANGIEPIDGPYAGFHDLETLSAEAQCAQLIGMGGKWAIHPTQINTIQQVFTPSKERIAQARKQQAAYAQAQQQGLGAISVDGIMVDAASIRITQSLLERADLLGL